MCSDGGASLLTAPRGGIEASLVGTHCPFQVEVPGECKGSLHWWTSADKWTLVPVRIVTG